MRDVNVGEAAGICAESCGSGGKDALRESAHSLPIPEQSGAHTADSEREQCPSPVGEWKSVCEGREGCCGSSHCEGEGVASRVGEANDRDFGERRADRYAAEPESCGGAGTRARVWLPYLRRECEGNDESGGG